MKIQTTLVSIVLAGALMAMGTASRAEATYMRGNVIDMTSLPIGLLIRLDTGAPTNCQNVPPGWMLIKAEQKPMVAMAMTAWATGRKTAIVYTTGVVGGYCEVNQYDPVE